MTQTPALNLEKTMEKAHMGEEKAQLVIQGRSQGSYCQHLNTFPHVKDKETASDKHPQVWPG